MIAIAEMFKSYLRPFGMPSDFPSSEERAPKRTWGDGLLDLSLSTAWHPATCDDVDDDELVFLMPALAYDLRSGTSAWRSAIADRARSALIAQLRQAAAAIDVSPSYAAAKWARATEFISESGNVASLSKLEVAEALATNACLRRPSHPLFAASRGLQGELSVLKALDRFHARALGLYHGTLAAEDGGERHVVLSDAVICSIHTAINAAYVLDEYEYAHELLSTAAWLGILLRGRRALMPVAVAECLIDSLQTRSGRADGDAQQITRVLTSHADRAMGAARLLKAARRVSKRGYCQEVSPRRGVRQMGSSH